MKNLIFITLFLLFAGQAESAQRKICLNMIVKNESDVICRCLESVKPLIDYWVIVDTGSTDGTQQMIKDFMKDVPGELYECPWVNFSYNRNQALKFASGKADYLLFIDGDNKLVFNKNFKLPFLNKDIYYIRCESNGVIHNQIQLVKSNLNWEWKGVLYETIESPQAKSYGLIKGVMNVLGSDGDRSKDPEKFLNDARILEKALQKNPENSRYVFYLAQSYKEAGDYAQALKYYQKRIEMAGGEEEEIFYSILQTGFLQELLNMTAGTIISSYNKAYLLRPNRVEPLYRLASFYRKMGNYEAAYQAALQGLSISFPEKDMLYVDKWVYDYGLLLEFSIIASALDKPREAMAACRLLLANKEVPSEIRNSIVTSIRNQRERMRLEPPEAPD